VRLDLASLICRTEYELQLFVQKKRKTPTGFFVLCCEFGLEKVLHIREFALQLLLGSVKVLDLASVILNFRLGIAPLNDLQYVGQLEYYEIAVD
jgi:hypothetical protein